MSDPTMFTKILVPQDGADLGGSVLPYVTQLARGLDSRATLLTVLDPDAVWDGGPDDRGIEVLIGHTRRKLDVIVYGLAEQGIVA